MKIVQYRDIVDKVSRACIDANHRLPHDVLSALENARFREESPSGIDILGQLIENAAIAGEGLVPLCQDTGFAVVFAEWGQEVIIEGGALIDAINEGVRRGYTDGYLRKSICHPLTRKNTGDNSPAVVHCQPARGDMFRITIAPKGGGSENMSRLVMLKPSDGRSGIIRITLDTIRDAGANPCPPLIVGIGIGGTFERCAFLAKRALLRPVGSMNPDPDCAALEQSILEEINKLGIGPMGLGGRVTALAVHIELEPCHIASLPVAINLSCHSSRHIEINF